MEMPAVQITSDKRMSTVLCTGAILPHEVVQTTSENDNAVQRCVRPVEDRLTGRYTDKPLSEQSDCFLRKGDGIVVIDDRLLGANLIGAHRNMRSTEGAAVHGKQSISFTFPEIQEFWDRLVRRMLISSALWLLLLLATIGTRQGMGDGPYLVVLLVFGGLQLALSLAYWNRENKLVPGINQRLAVEFMLRTGTPTPPGDLDILQIKQIVTARDEDGAARVWIVKRRRDVFTLTSA